jgi:hypothetical protein
MGHAAQILARTSLIIYQNNYINRSLFVVIRSIVLSVCSSGNLSLSPFLLPYRTPFTETALAVIQLLLLRVDRVLSLIATLLLSLPSFLPPSLPLTRSRARLLLARAVRTTAAFMQPSVLGCKQADPRPPNAPYSLPPLPSNFVEVPDGIITSTIRAYNLQLETLRGTHVF